MNCSARSNPQLQNLPTDPAHYSPVSRDTQLGGKGREERRKKRAEESIAHGREAVRSESQGHEG